MSRALLLPAGGDVVAAAANVLVERLPSLARALAVFPGKRPSYFLHRALAQRIGGPFRAPSVVSMDELVAHWFERIEPGTAPVNAADGAALLYHFLQERGLPGSPGGRLDLDEFLPWGFTLFSDFEELRIEGATPERLRAVQALAAGSMPERMRHRLGDLSRIYERFYDELGAEKCATRSARYAAVAAASDGIPLDEFDVIALAGFFALTASEKRLIARLLSDDRTTLILQDGPGIGELIAGLGISPERSGEARHEPRYHFIKGADAHSEVMALARSLARGDGQAEVAIVLPSADSLFPVIEAVLPAFGDDWNISMGFPLSRTPAFALMDAMAAAQAGRDGDAYHVPDYLKLLLHPYIKNIMLRGSSRLGRILAHTIEERLSGRQQRFISPDAVARDPAIIGDFLGRTAGLDAPALTAEQVTGHLDMLHRLLLRPFEQPENVGVFTASLLQAVSHVSLHSPANRHPFSPAFIEAMVRALETLGGSRLASESFGSAAGYFRFAAGALSQETVPFDGTPLKKLQVLGFLETRALRFDTVHILDCNEGLLPRGRQPDTILPQALRRELGLPLQRQRDGIVRYYFENLVAGARVAHIYYREGADLEKSRLVEQLLWQQQQAAGSLNVPAQMPVFFASAFDQHDPRPVVKSAEVAAVLRAMTYSATKLDAYLKCPLAFHYRHVLGLDERAAPADDIDRREIGTMVHGILEEFFRARCGRPFALGEEDDARITAICRERFRQAYGEPLDGGLRLIRSQTEARLRDVLDYHRRELAGISIAECERTLSAPLATENGTVALTGRIDRIDRRPAGVTILDYKTGATAGRPNGKTFSLDDRAQWHRTLKSFQLPLYVILYHGNHPGTPVAGLNSSLMLLGGPAIEEKPLFAGADDREELLGRYRQAAVRLIEEIMDPSVPFTQSPDPESHCPNCAYKTPCGRQWMRPAF